MSRILSVLGTYVQKHCLAEVAVLVGKSGDRTRANYV